MNESTQSDVIVDVVGETCPIPLVEMRKAVRKSKSGQVIEVKGTHGASKKEIPMEVMGIKKEQLDVTLIDEFGAVGMYVKETKEAQTSLFI